MRKSKIAKLALAAMLSGTCLAQANETPVKQLIVDDSQQVTTPTQLDAPLQIIVSRKDQTLRVYRGTEIVASSNVSTGKKGHATPTGIFSILEKRRKHFSNLYDSAPMPFMQRLTWSGIALHESNSVPSYPASHGCVRLPGAFAKELFGMTERGAHVIIANREAAPTPIENAHLFQPEDMDLANKLSSLDVGGLEKQQGLGKISLLSDRAALDPVAHILAKRLNQFEDVRKSDKPLRIFITRQDQGNLVRNVQTLLNELGFNAGAADGLAGKDTYTALRKFLASKKGSIETRMMSTRAVINKELLQQLYLAAGKGPVPTGHLYVRHNFKPLFDMPIQIKSPEKPLGAHLFTANSSQAGTHHLQWLAVNLGDKLTEDQQSKLGVYQDSEESGIVDSEEVLDRIMLPQIARDQINYLIKNGSSLTISDRGLSRETTEIGTDFIVLTKPTLQAETGKAVAKATPVKPKRVSAPAASATKTPPKRKTLFSMFANRSLTASN